MPINNNRAGGRANAQTRGATVVLPLCLGLVLALLAPWTVHSSISIATQTSLRPLTCASMSILQKDPGISVALRTQLREDMEYCPGSDAFERMLESPALELERFFRHFTWLKSSSEREAMRQLEKFIASFSWGGEFASEEFVKSHPAATTKQVPSSMERPEGPSTSGVLQHGERLAACSLPTSGNRTVGSDCNQESTVALTGV